MLEIFANCRNLIDFFEVCLRRKGLLDKTCLEIIRKDRQEKLSFGQLKTRSKEFANYLIEQENIQIGDKVALLGKNRAEWDIAFWGVVLAGAVPVLIDPERRSEGVKKHLLHTDSKILIAADDYQDEFLFTLGVDLIDMTAYTETESDNNLQQIAAKVKLDDTAVILCTSGTTADPKEVELTHTNLINNIEGSLAIVKIGPKDRLGHILPPHHSFGLTVGKLLPLSVGAVNIYTDKYGQIGDLIKDKKVTIFVAVPVLFKALAKRLKKLKYWQKVYLKKKAWRKLRFCISGSAALSKDVLNIFWQTGIELREGYGTTENSPVYGFNINPNKLGCVGKPIPNLFVKIVKQEILLGGPCIMKGYYKNPEATAKVIETDKNNIRWLHTGDLGYLDEDGDLFITGRKKYVIVLPSGKNVAPELVESVLSGTKYVKEILVVPFCNGLGAFVLPDYDEIDEETSKNPLLVQNLVWKSINDLQDKSPELAPFERIKSKPCIRIVDDFERTTTKKIKREFYLNQALK